MRHQFVLELHQSAGTRPRSILSSNARAVALRALVFSSSCCCRPTCLRRDWPRLRRSSGVAQCMIRDHTLSPRSGATRTFPKPRVVPPGPFVDLNWKSRIHLPRHGVSLFPSLEEILCEASSRSPAPPLFAVLFATCIVAAQAPARKLSVEDIYAHGPLIGTPPRGITWSPDGKHLTYLDGGELIDLAPGSGKPHVL